MNVLESLIETIAAARRPLSVCPDAALLDAVASRRFSVVYQPIVAVNDEVIAWRAKSCFWDVDGKSLSPTAVFSALHDFPALLLAAELQLKGLAIAQAPEDSRLLLSLDADSYAIARQPGGNSFDRLFDGQSRWVVEICENRPMMDVARLRHLSRRLSAQGIPLAVGRHTPLAFYHDVSLSELDWVRLPCPGDLRDVRRIRAMASIAEAAQRAGCVAFVSDVRTPEALALVRSMGFSAASGPVFDSLGMPARAGASRSVAVADSRHLNVGAMA